MQLKLNKFRNAKKKNENKFIEGQLQLQGQGKKNGISHFVKVNYSKMAKFLFSLNLYSTWKFDKV